MLNNCGIRYTIERDQWYDRKGYFHSSHQQSPDKGDLKTAESDADVSVSITKTSARSRL